MESQAFLSTLAVEQQRVKSNRVAGVKIALLVLSSRAMAFDTHSLRHEILLTYPDATVFFRTTQGKPIGPESPRHVDLVIDFTGPRQRQGWLYAKRLRSMARFAVGRNAGLFRKKIYDRVYDEKSSKIASRLPADLFERERHVQREVLGLAGVAFIQQGSPGPDRGKTIALELPPLNRL